MDQQISANSLQKQQEAEMFELRSEVRGSSQVARWAGSGTHMRHLLPPARQVLQLESRVLELERPRKHSSLAQVQLGPPHRQEHHEEGRDQVSEHPGVVGLGPASFCAGAVGGFPGPWAAAELGDSMKVQPWVPVGTVGELDRAQTWSSSALPDTCCRKCGKRERKHWKDKCEWHAGEHGVQVTEGMPCPTHRLTDPSCHTLGQCWASSCRGPMRRPGWQGSAWLHKLW